MSFQLGDPRPQDAVGDVGEGDFLFEGFVVRHDRIVDQLLRKIHQLGVGAQGIPHSECLGASEQVLVEAESDEPEYLVVHASGAKLRQAARQVES